MNYDGQRGDIIVRRSNAEAIIQRQVFVHLRTRATPGVVAFHCPNGGYRRPVEAAILKGMGVLSGVPDVIAVKRGQTYALELKAPNGRMSNVQHATCAALMKAGAMCAVAYGIDDALRQLEAWGLLQGRAA